MARYHSVLRLFLLIALALIAISHAEETEAAASSTEAAVDEAAEAATEAAQKVADAVEEAVDTAAEEAAAAAAEAAQAKAQEVADATAQAVEEASEEAAGILTKAKDAVTSSGDKVVAFVKDFKLSKDSTKKIAAGVVGVWGVATAGGWAMDKYGKDKEE